jgi:predicted tellurium resistance membrane protein TerC
VLDWIADPQIWASLATLTLLEVILGIDNVIFVAIATQKLPPHQQRPARQVGLGLALVLRLVFLAMITWIVGLTAPIFTALGHEVSWRDLILIAGGLFLLYKGTQEVHGTIEGYEEDRTIKAASFAAIISQIIVLDLVFSLDSVITAVGMTDNLPVMYAAVIIAVGTMLWASGPISTFVHRHPTVKMLALAFLLLIGVALIADGLHFHIPRGYLYFAIAFSMGVEILNLLARRGRSVSKAAAPPEH